MGTAYKGITAKGIRTSQGSCRHPTQGPLRTPRVKEWGGALGTALREYHEGPTVRGIRELTLTVMTPKLRRVLLVYGDDFKLVDHWISWRKGGS